MLLVQAPPVPVDEGHKRNGIGFRVRHIDTSLRRKISIISSPRGANASGAIVFKSAMPIDAPLCPAMSCYCMLKNWIEQEMDVLSLF